MWAILDQLSHRELYLVFIDFISHTEVTVSLLCELDKTNIVPPLSKSEEYPHPYQKLKLPILVVRTLNTAFCMDGFPELELKRTF